MATSSKIIPVLQASFAASVWGASFIATKVAVGEISPNTVVWLRFTMGVIILGATLFWRKQFAWIAPREWLYFALLGFLGITFHQWLQSNGLVTAQATTTAWIVSTTPIFMALLGWLVLKEKLGWVRIAGIALAALGVLLIVSNGDLTSLSAGKFGTTGDYLVMGSSLNWAVFSAASRSGLQKHPATRMLFYVMTLGWIFLSLLFVSETGYTEVVNLSLRGWLAVFFLGIFCSGLAYIFWYDALQVLPAAQLGAFLYVEPLIAVIVAAVVLGEAFTLATLGSGGLILFGVWLVNRPADKDSAHEK